MKLKINLLATLIFTGGLFAQDSISPETNINIQDNAKVGAIISGTGNSINITQTILPKSLEYNTLQADSARLKKILDEKNIELSNAIGNPTLEEYIRKERNHRAQEYQNALKRLTDFKEDVQRLAETFGKISLNSERLRTAKALFNEGKIREADTLLKTQEMEQETDALLSREKRLRLEEVENDSLLEIKSIEWLIKAYITKTRFDLFEWFDSTNYYFRRSIQCFADANNLFDYAIFLQNHHQYDSALVYYQFATDKFLAVKDTASLGAIQNNLGNLYAGVNSYEQAEAAYLKALHIYQQFAQNNPQLYKLDLVGTLNNLGTLYADHYAYEKATLAFLEASKILKELVENDPKYFEREVAAIQNNLGVMFRNLNAYEKAETAYLKALKILKQLAEGHPESFDADVATTLNNLGWIYLGLNAYKKAEATYLQALETYKRLAQNNPQRFEPALAAIHSNLALVYLALEIPTEAEVAFLKALKLFEQQMPSNSQRVEPDLAGTLNNLGGFYASQNMYDKAEKAYSEALEIYKRLAQGNPQRFEPILAATKNCLGHIFINQKTYQKAEGAYQDALEIFDRLTLINPGLYGPDVAITYGNLSRLHLLTRKFNEAEEAAIQGLKIDPSQNRNEVNLACALLFQGRYSEFETICAKYKGETFNNKLGFTNAFLQNLSDLEKRNIMHPNIEKVRELLKEYRSEH